LIISLSNTEPVSEVSILNIDFVSFVNTCLSDTLLILVHGCSEWAWLTFVFIVVKKVAKLTLLALLRVRITILTELRVHERFAKAGCVVNVVVRVTLGANRFEVTTNFTVVGLHNLGACCCISDKLPENIALSAHFDVFEAVKAIIIDARNLWDCLMVFRDLTRLHEIVEVFVTVQVLINLLQNLLL